MEKLINQKSKYFPVSSILNDEKEIILPKNNVIFIEQYLNFFRFIWINSKKDRRFTSNLVYIKDINNKKRMKYLIKVFIKVVKELILEGEIREIGWFYLDIPKFEKTLPTYE